ncbi:MAG TPA: MFS transporter [Rhizomicrobium sp.]|jgi:ACS family hexuronate transporter-like MFS transporter|nr:MFS transporter [Rhizomicrobium sp.]
MNVQTPPVSKDEVVAAAARRAGSYRWMICGLLFAATAINYVDRQILGVLKPTLQHDLGWNELQYADIVFWFQAAYAVGYLGFGRLIDKIGARLGFAGAIVIWTVAHIAHAAVRTVFGFTMVRVGLGVGESGNFPAGIKAVAEWFPKSERALATSIFNAGSGIGAIITPLIVPYIVIAFGWRAAFVITGSFSLIWLVVWLRTYTSPRDSKHVTPGELAFIESDPPDAEAHAHIPWLRLLRVRETWAYAIAKFLIDPIWWMYLFWLPGFFADRYHLDLKSFGPPVVAVYIMSDIGSVAGGWLSSQLIKMGFSINAARKLTMLVSCFAILPIVFAMRADNLWLAVGILGVATAAHQSFSANLYTLPSDVFPRAAVASVIGIGGTVGAIGGMLMAKYTGWVLQSLGTYTPIFVVAAAAYALALLVVHILSPRYALANVD